MFVRSLRRSLHNESESKTLQYLKASRSGSRFKNFWIKTAGRRAARRCPRPGTCRPPDLNLALQGQQSDALLTQQIDQQRCNVIKVFFCRPTSDSKGFALLRVRPNRVKPCKNWIYKTCKKNYTPLQAIVKTHYIPVKNALKITAPLNAKLGNIIPQDPPP